MDIGSKGLCEVNLTIPQSTSLNFTVVHKDEAGDVVDHSGSTAKMAFQSRDGATTYDLSDCCACTSQAIAVNIPKSVTDGLPLGKLVWDMIVQTQSGGSVRMCYGAVSIIDTYALDGD